MKNAHKSVIALLFCPMAMFAQGTDDSLGFEVGIFQVRPEAYVQGSYDDRVAYSRTGKAEDDFYGELGLGVYVVNKDAKYQLSGYGTYGYRKYQEYSSLDNDFYEGSVAVASRQSPLQYGIRGTTKKTLSYDTAANLEQGQEPDEILTAGASTLNTADADIGYVKQLGEKVSITPGYSIVYYQQDFEGQEDAEWHIHQASLRLGYDYTADTMLTLDFGAQYQVNDDENGTVGYVAAGARSRFSDKTSWIAELGVTVADYEESGSSQSLYGMLRAVWQATEKVSLYTFGSSNFSPGYGGGSARKVYRLGYGASWSPLEKWVFSTQFLHDYQEEINDNATQNPANKETRFFFDAVAGYSLSRRIDLALSGRFAYDEEKDNQTIISLRADFRY